MENQISPPPNVPFDPAPPVVTPGRNKTVLIIIFSTVLFLAIVAVGLYVGFSLISKPAKITPIPIVEPSPPPAQIIPAVPSKFASDSALLKIREDLKKTQGDIDTVDLFDAQISPPSIDLGIQIQ